MSEQYYYAETTGFLTDAITGRNVRAGVTAMVLDRLNMHRPVALFRSEEMQGRSGGGPQATARKKARQTCESLNRGGSVIEARRNEIGHGKRWTYIKYGCRCAACTNANRLFCLAYRKRRRARPS